jgi:multiple sugar transport system permease protein
MSPSRRDARTVALLVLPFLGLFVLFYLLPIGYAFWQSLHGLRRSGAYEAPETVFVGPANYAQVLADPAFRASLVHLVQFSLGPTVLILVAGLVIALLIDARPPGGAATFARTAVYVPFAVPAVLGALVWGFIYAPGTSPVVALVGAVGWDVNPLTLPPVWAVGNIAFWTYVGFTVLVLLAGLASIDRGILESARLDGASPARLAWSIKVPLIRPSIVLSVVFNTVGTIQLFAEPSALRSLTLTFPSGWTPNMLAYSEAAAGRFGHSASIAVILAVVTGLLSYLVLRAAGPDAPR